MGMILAFLRFEEFANFYDKLTSPYYCICKELKTREIQ